MSSPSSIFERCGNFFWSGHVPECVEKHWTDPSHIATTKKRIDRMLVDHLLRQGICDYLNPLKATTTQLHNWLLIQKSK